MGCMSDYFRAIAVDYDGTLTTGPRPEECVLSAIRLLRSANRRVVLVTGRILSELAGDFPDVYEHFDAIVAENGAVLWHAGRARPLVAGISTKLSRQLRELGIPARSGMVILALEAVHDEAVRKQCVALGLDHQLIRNREALMVLPAGISKASGLLDALGQLGVSHHSAIGIGDAENDIALLEACEIGVAVANAVPSLKERADLVLNVHGGAAIADFLSKDVLSNLPGVQPLRHRVELGTASDGSIASVPASRIQVFVDGPTGAGKSYLTGLFAERLTEMRYTICVLDMEGEHAALGQLRGVLALGGRTPLPTPEEVARFVRHRFSSLVLDLSLREPALKHEYVRDVIEQLTRARQECGLPHWILIEEAHSVPADALERARASGSLCLVTYHPDWLPHSVLRGSDVQITLEPSTEARLRWVGNGRPPVSFRPAARGLVHVRHRRKYADSQVPYERGFVFRDASGRVGKPACSIAEFYVELAQIPRSVLAHHAPRLDFSRWIRDVFQDKPLADSVRRAEERFSAEDADGFRRFVRELVALRHELNDEAVCVRQTAS
ncbi:MAG TPA: HAD hydrolase family protein [Polyangiaceae bacterium]